MRTATLRGLATLAVGVAVGMVTVSLARGPQVAGSTGRPTPAPSPSHVHTISTEAVGDVLAYLDEVMPLAEEGGRVVQEGMKRAITELSKPDGDHDAQAQLAPAWLESMTDLGRRWAEVTPPPELTGAHKQFLQAWELYLQAAEALVEATQADDPGAHTSRVIDLGERADAAWNAAGAMAQDLLGGFGSPPVTWLPSSGGHG